MNKKLWWAVPLVIVLAVIFYAMMKSNSTVPQPAPIAFDPLNATYVIENRPVALFEGKSSDGTAMVFGQPVTGDLNGDGKPDAALVLVTNPGGSGTFYYVVVAINATNGPQGTNGILLGDRIAPQDISIKDGEVIVDYADRKPSDPMSAPPSIGVTKYFALNGSALLTTTTAP